MPDAPPPSPSEAAAPAGCPPPSPAPHSSCPSWRRACPVPPVLARQAPGHHLLPLLQARNRAAAARLRPRSPARHDPPGTLYLSVRDALDWPIASSLGPGARALKRLWPRSVGTSSAPNPAARCAASTTGRGGSSIRLGGGQAWPAARAAGAAARAAADFLPGRRRADSADRPPVTPQLRSHRELQPGMGQ